MSNRSTIGMFTVIITQLGWLYGRLICLPILIHEIYGGFTYAPDRGHLQPYISFSILFLSTLVVLHVYWFYLFMQLNYNFVVKGETRDIQND